jgi:hypothetical protein
MFVPPTRPIASRILTRRGDYSLWFGPIPQGRSRWLRRAGLDPETAIPGLRTRRRQNDPNTDPSTMTATDAMITLTTTVMIMWK